MRAEGIFLPQPPGWPFPTLVWKKTDCPFINHSSSLCLLFGGRLLFVFLIPHLSKTTWLILRLSRPSPSLCLGCHCRSLALSSCPHVRRPSKPDGCGRGLAVYTEPQTPRPALTFSLWSPLRAPPLTALGLLFLKSGFCADSARSWV